MDALSKFECGKFVKGFFSHFPYVKLETLIALIYLTFSCSVDISFKFYFDLFSIAAVI